MLNVNFTGVYFVEVYSRLDLVQVARLHLQELIYRDACAQSRDDDTEEEHRATSYSQFLPTQHVEQLRLMQRPGIKTATQESICQQSCHHAYHHRSLQEWLTDKAP